MSIKRSHFQMDEHNMETAQTAAYVVSYQGHTSCFYYLYLRTYTFISHYSTALFKSKMATHIVDDIT